MSEYFRLHFSFGTHSAEAVRYLPGVKQQAEAFFQPNQRNIFWFEAAGNRPRDIVRFQESYKRWGAYFNALMVANETVKNPTRSKLNSLRMDFEERKFELMRMNVGELSKQHDDYFNIYSFDLLDNLPKNLGVEVVPEASTDEQAAQVLTWLVERDKYNHGYLLALAQGNPDRAEDFYKRFILTTARQAKFRNEITAAQIIRIADEARENRILTNLMVREGLGHNILPFYLERQGFLTNFSISYDYPEPYLPYYYQLVQRIEKQEFVSPSKREVFRAILDNSLDAYLQLNNYAQSARARIKRKIIEAVNQDEVEFIKSINRGGSFTSSCENILMKYR